MAIRIEPVTGVSLGWGESVRWDERRQRLFFVDCVARALHWLDDGTLETRTMPSVPAGMALTETGSLVIALDDGLHVVEPESGRGELLTAYPPGMGGRANDLCADFEGNLITGKMNLGPAPGSSWWFSVRDGWKLIDDRISNTNGPGVAELRGEMTLVIGDTSADYYAYPYDPRTGRVGERRVFGDTAGGAGRPDGSAFDEEGGLWCAMVGGGRIARFVAGREDRSVKLPVTAPTDLAFGGAGLDQLYVTSIGVPRGDADPEPDAGALFVIEGLGVRGRIEPRFRT